ncbi:hypothetical protein D0962_16425 [Leptolyngbyaceae cyanobacterium CCMR0082]|uniref:Uncharacterized protein n=1 Tax=Adonisia turfae CCMR0082 TaxID=2304604 RepID=A0A6M0S7C0_9CYAN|nr:hypothetical protein [Adonisia turfae CCMR0082]
MKLIQRYCQERNMQLHHCSYPNITTNASLTFATQTLAPVKIPSKPMTPPPNHGDSLFWTIIAISILVKAIFAK